MAFRCCCALVIAAAASEPEANERGSSLISRRTHYKGLQSLFLTKRKDLWLCANERFRMRSGMPQGIVVMSEWEDLGCAAYQSHVEQKVTKFHLHHVELLKLVVIKDYERAFDAVTLIQIP